MDLRKNNISINSICGERPSNFNSLIGFKIDNNIPLVGCSNHKKIV